MDKKIEVQIPKEIFEFFWTRYIPETTYKVFVTLGHINGKYINKNTLSSILSKINSPEEYDFEKVSAEKKRIMEEKKRVIKKLGFKYPANFMDDLELLLNYKLIRVQKQKDKIAYAFSTNIPEPKEVLPMDKEELGILENIKFEMCYQNAINVLLAQLIDKNGNLNNTLGDIQRMTKLKLIEIKKVLEYLKDEGSITIDTIKEISKLKKEDKIHININKEIFEQKRLVI